MSSHHFFQIKKDGEEDKLKLKFRLVRHGNRDSEKDQKRTDSFSTQCTAICGTEVSGLIVINFREVLHWGCTLNYTWPSRCYCAIVHGLL